ncbi:hypothetical protein M405DRAFT_932722 [Rhizopogon salebrosus TDB-379]|nr:hypothetical protein M405DRAFT_932722 [Rhizopogon salebrosus TDB-379]
MQVLAEMYHQQLLVKISTSNVIEYCLAHGSVVVNVCSNDVVRRLCQGSLAVLLLWVQLYQNICWWKCQVHNRSRVRVRRDEIDKFQLYRSIDDVDAFSNTTPYEMRYAWVLRWGHPKARPSGSLGWEEIEATLHCIVSIQEAAPQQLPLLEDNPFLAQLFGSNVPSRFPTDGTYEF